jgi:hypothetical protein
MIAIAKRTFGIANFTVKDKKYDHPLIPEISNGDQQM